MPKLSFPSSIILSTIKAGHVYKDEYSFEKSTRVTKRKYKLAGQWPKQLKSQNVRIFFVSTSKPASVQGRVCVKIEHADYTECKQQQLRDCTSYYDLTKWETLSGEEVKKKIDDPLNGFEDVATVNNKAFKRFLEKTTKLKIQTRPPVSVLDIKNIAESVVDEAISEQVLKNLHLI